MKKVWSLAVVFALVLSLTSISAYAANNNPMDHKQSRASDSTKSNMNNYRANDDGNVNGNTNNELRANNNNNMMNNQTGRYNANSTNYRATAVDNDRGTDWGWLGLLGLTGLLGLRSRSRERT
ncbi:WGxxGxxG family protein [Paenibacillus camelliae]|uniref:WGxxGxxG family protein n=1 Tax=Paenibacillus camelliae TaxID=512410 RepID=UPI00203EA7D9|nr:WGxxGxxG family protein [Paenibacillus camelliae]MCM3636050.1 WGxxGxxG-CTERM domain-containing protein [Paenibacillus camelliae]